MNLEIHKQALISAKLYLKAERDLLRILIQIDKERIYEHFEYTFLTPYCINKLGLSENIAKCLVRVVRKSHEVPELGAAVIAGALPLYKARVICSAITPENKSEWIAKAQSMSKEKLELEVATARGIKTKKVPFDLSFETIEKIKRSRDVFSTMSAKFMSLEETIDRMAEDFLFKNDPVEKALRSKKPSVKQEVDHRDLGRCSVIYQDGTQCVEEKWIHH